MFMMIEAVTVFLALIGTTLSCINTGARVTFAMGRDEEVPEHFGLLHGGNLTPHRAIWTLGTISAVLGAYAALYFFAGGSAPDDKTIATLPHNHMVHDRDGLKREPGVLAQRPGARNAGVEFRNIHCSTD